MKILWVKSDFLHPTTKGGHIRTLETLKRLHQRHEIHYVALDLPEQRGGVERSGEYCTKAYPIPHSVPARNTAGYFLQAFGGLFSSMPVSVSRYQSDAMQRQVETLQRAEKFDAIVCDFLFPAVNISDLGSCVLFQHNVEAMIWKRHAETAASTLRRAYFGGQYDRMLRFEGEVCRAVKSIIAVSDVDAATMRSKYGGSRIAAVPTGVDVDYFTPKGEQQPSTDLIFLGSMDWMPNIDGVQWFVNEILPLIRKQRPECSVAIVGRTPDAGIQQLAQNDKSIRVTGTVPDVRPYLWEVALSIVPLRIGGGTRLKIYEAMAAKIPVVSTTVGAEGLDVCDGENIHIADSPAEFANRCLALLEDKDSRCRMAQAAFEMISSRYSWDVVSRRFEELL
jgi:glycosyltransferase involved in cell wall biosynthesis